MSPELNKKKFNILLINPAQTAVYEKMKPPIQIHMGLAYIAAALTEDKSNNIKIIDIDAEGLRPRDFTKIIKRKHYDIAGITVTTPTFFSSLELAKQIKSYSPHTLIAFGGIHPTIKPHEVINYDCVDMVIKGEGEITFREAISSLRHHRDLSDVNGLVFKKNKKIKETPERPLIKDLDLVPFPARHLFKTQRYTYPDALYRSVAPIMTSRGCSGMCTYCNANKIFSRVFRSRSAKNIVDEVELLVKKRGTKEIHIWDDNFATSRKRIFEIRDEILKRNIKIKFAFPNGIRADFLNEEIMQALKEMGTYSIAIGVESGSKHVLSRARKGIKQEKIEEIFVLAKKMKFETWAFFIIGLPGENAFSIAKTIHFVQKIDPDIAKFHILKPYPGTEVYDYLRSKRYILTEDYNKFGIHTPPIHRLETLMPSDMVEWQKKAYRSFYLRPFKIARQILRIKTFNRFKLNLCAGIGLIRMVFSK